VIDEVQSVRGRVRRITWDETPAAGPYTAIALAGDPARYVDFDAPDEWDDLGGATVEIQFVEIQFVEQENASTGYTYRRVLDVSEVDA
jgi:hypothetical protein